MYSTNRSSGCVNSRGSTRPYHNKLQQTKPPLPVFTARLKEHIMTDKNVINSQSQTAYLGHLRYALGKQTTLISNRGCCVYTWHMHAHTVYNTCTYWAHRRLCLGLGECIRDQQRKNERPKLSCRYTVEFDYRLKPARFGVRIRKFSGHACVIRKVVWCYP